MRPRFGVSTHLYQRQRLGREHLLEIAAYGFDSVELVATRTHVDYHSEAAVADVQQWLAEAGLALQRVHAPVREGLIAGRATGPLSIASADPTARARAVEEGERALHIARRIPFEVLVTHLGFPRAESAPGDQNRDAARRSLEELQRVAEPLGVRIAIEVIPNELSRPGSLVHFLEHDLDAPGVGICLDLGHAHLDGDLLDTIETVSEHVIAADLHDNRGRGDDHLVPFEGTIDWPSALTAMQKVGFEGPLVFEVAPRGTPKETLQKAQRARGRLERML